MHDNTLTNDGRDKFIQIAERYGQQLIFYNVVELCADKFSAIKEYFPDVYSTNFSIAMFYRFFIPYLLPQDVEKVIYLDSDIIVNLDIDEFWQIDLGDKPLGAIPNLFQIKDEKASNERTSKFIPIVKEGFIKPEDYLNSGVLLMNLKVLRNERANILAGVKFISEHPQFPYLDQDILNYCFSTTYLKLPVKFNRIVFFARSENELFIEEKIYHYAGGKGSLGLYVSDPFNRLWWSFFIKTPWFDVDTINKILKGTTDSILQPSIVTSGKARSFIVDEEHAYQIEKNFSVRYEEEVIVVDTGIEESLQKLIDLMNSSRDKNIFFIGISNIAPKLKKFGFVEDKDFFDVSEFYSPIWANRTNNHKLILAM